MLPVPSSELGPPLSHSQESVACPFVRIGSPPLSPPREYCLSLRRNWVPPTPPLGPKGGEDQHSLAVRGWGVPSYDWKESLALYLLCAYEHHLPHSPHHLLDVTNETEGVARNGVLPSLAGADGGIMRDLYGEGKRGSQQNSRDENEKKRH